MQIRIIKPGLLTTVQDLGRWNYLSQAVPVSGAMDTYSARMANKCVGNDDHAAILEFNLHGAEFIADNNLLIAFSGGGSAPEINGQALPLNRPLFIPAGVHIRMGNSDKGSRMYLAIAGGWNVPVVLGSLSTYVTAGFGGLDGRALKPGDVLQNEAVSALSQKILDALKGNQVNYARWSVLAGGLPDNDYSDIRIIPGREFGWFDHRSIIDILTESFTISNKSNRMGYHLEGPPMARRFNTELLSTAVTPGTIQVTGNGSMILLMADCQTTGGYPRIAQVAAVDLPLCGQLRAGDRIKFEEISMEQAEKLYFEQETQLQEIGTVILNKYE